MNDNDNPPRLKVKVNNILRVLHIYLHIVRKPNSKLFKLFIKNVSKYLLVDFLQTFSLFLNTVSGYKRMFFLVDTPQKVNKIHQAICLAIAYSCNYFFHSDLV